MEIWPGLCSPAGWVAYHCSSVFFLLSLIAGALPAVPLVAGPMDGGQGAGLLQGLSVFLASLPLPHHPHIQTTRQKQHALAKVKERMWVQFSSTPFTHYLFLSYPSSSCFLPARSKGHVLQNVRRIRIRRQTFAQRQEQGKHRKLYLIFRILDGKNIRKPINSFHHCSKCGRHTVHRGSWVCAVACI